MPLKIKKILILIAIMLCCAVSGFAENITTEPLPTLTADDRILIFAPHPDDEAIGTAGVIQQAVKQGIPIKVVYLTNGDNNELAFIIYSKHLVIRKNAFINYGRIRRDEAVKAMRLAGLKDDQLIFLGYPDFGTFNIFISYWGAVKPFKSLFTRVQQVPYKDAFSPNAAYLGDNILRDLDKILLDFKPTKIFVTNPVDSNGDHRACFLFLQVALWDIEDQIPAPAIYPYLIHLSGWPKPRGYHPDSEIIPPAKLNHDLSWFSLPLEKAVIQKKYDMINLYKSQIEYNPPYLFTFARKNELFGRYPVVEVKEKEIQPIGQSHLEKLTGVEGQFPEEKDVQNKFIESVVYTKAKGFLEIKITSQRWKDKLLGTNLFLFSYNKKIPFADMPKIRISMSNWGTRLKFYDKQKDIEVAGVEVKFNKQDLIIRFPLKELKDPDYILTSVRMRSGNLPLSATAWRALKLK